MKEENKIYLAAIRRAMQDRLQFENRNDRNEAFATFWYGWAHQRMRKYGSCYQTFQNRWKRGFLSKAEAHEFWLYIIQ